MKAIVESDRILPNLFIGPIRGSMTKLVINWRLGYLNKHSFSFATYAILHCVRIALNRARTAEFDQSRVHVGAASGWACL